MAKTKTSKKRGFSFDDMSVVRVKKSGKLESYDPKQTLGDGKFVAEALMQALLEGDAEAFKEILSAHLELVNKDRFSKQAGIPKRTLFRMLSPEGNPTLDSVAKVMRSLSKAA